MINDQLLLLGVLTAAVIGALLAVIAYALRLSRLAEMPIEPSLGENPTKFFSFAGVDVNSGDRETIEREADEAADKLEFLLAYAPSLPSLAKRVRLNLEFADGSTLAAGGPRDHLELRFCIGDSMFGAGLLNGSLMATVPASGTEFAEYIKDWHADGLWKPGARLEKDGFLADLEMGSYRWPSGVVLTRGNLVSIAMSTEMIEVYKQALARRPALAKILTPTLSKCYFTKIRIFGGVRIDDSGNPVASLYRFPKGADKAVASKDNAKLSRLEALVPKHWPEVEWSSWLAKTSLSRLRT